MSDQKVDLASIAVREAVQADRNFILATWLRGLYYGSDWHREIPKDIFMENYHQVLDHILKKARVSVACLSEDPEVILGYSVRHSSANGEALDWVFVKSAWRNIGIGRLLIPQDVTIVTHLTKVGLSMLRKNPKVHFNPFSL